MSDTYDDMAIESAEPVHRAFCRVKIVRDKVSEECRKCGECVGVEGWSIISVSL